MNNRQRKRAEEILEEVRKTKGKNHIFSIEGEIIYCLIKLIEQEYKHEPYCNCDKCIED